MPTQVTNYQCPSCTGPLQFSAATGKLECEYCGSSFSVAEVEALYARKNAKAAQAEQKTETPEGEWGEDGAHMRAYNCPSCGAELICEETTAAASCPYCGNPSIVPGKFGGTKKPDYVIPFRVEKQAAIAALKAHYKGKPLLPKAFAAENHLQEIKGVYVPFWLFNGEAEANVTFEATRSRVHQTRDERIITTDHYQVGRSGSVAFQRVPVDGSSKMPDEHMDAIEPFDYGDLQPFSLGYLPGYLADKYDVGEADSAARAEERCRNSAVDAMRDSVVGYESCSVRHADVRIRREKAGYALLPVWMLNTRWKDKNYLFAMNGQTGRLIGDLPVSWGKLIVWFAVIFAAAFLLGTMFFAPEEAIIGALIIAAVVCVGLYSTMKSARRQRDANSYIPPVGIHITGRYDRFTHTTHVRQRIQHGDGGPRPPRGPEGRR